MHRQLFYISANYNIVNRVNPNERGIKKILFSRNYNGFKRLGGLHTVDMFHEIHTKEAHYISRNNIQNPLHLRC